MSPDSKLYGRVSIGANRSSLGHAPLTVLLIRASQEIQKAKHREEMIITLELSPSKLPDSTVFDKAAVMEQQVAAQIITDNSTESPFPGITIGRVAEAMMSPEYISWEAIATDPNRRIGLSQWDVDTFRQEYDLRFPDCSPHFPKWIY